MFVQEIGLCLGNLRIWIKFLDSSPSLFHHYRTRLHSAGEVPYVAILDKVERSGLRKCRSAEWSPTWTTGALKQLEIRRHRETMKSIKGWRYEVNVFSSLPREKIKRRLISSVLSGFLYPVEILPVLNDEMKEVPQQTQLLCAQHNYSGIEILPPWQEHTGKQLLMRTDCSIYPCWI